MSTMTTDKSTPNRTPAISNISAPGFATEHCVPSGTSLLQILIFAFAFSLPLSGETLESSNPFLPAGYGEEKEVAPPPVVVPTNGPISREIEFRGLAKLEGVYQFSVFNKSEQKSYWLTENEAAAQGLTVRSYDPESRSITVAMNGRSERLTLKSASDSPLPVVSSMPQPNRPDVTPPNLPPGLTNNANANRNNNGDNRRRVIPRRRVILPKK